MAESRKWSRCYPTLRQCGRNNREKKYHEKSIWEVCCGHKTISFCVISGGFQSRCAFQNSDGKNRVMENSRAGSAQMSSAVNVHSGDGRFSMLFCALFEINLCYKVETLGDVTHGRMNSLAWRGGNPLFAWCEYRVLTSRHWKRGSGQHGIQVKQITILLWVDIIWMKESSTFSLKKDEWCALWGSMAFCNILSRR